MNELTRRRFLSMTGGAGLALAAATGGVAVTGCGRGDAGGPLRLLTESSPGGEPAQAAVALFNERAGSAVIQVDAVPNADVQQKMILSFARGTGEYDLVTMSIAHAAAVRNYLLPLGEYVERDGLDLGGLVGDRLVIQEKGEPIAIPYSQATNVFAYRKDLFEAEGLQEPPATMSAWREVARRLTKGPAEERRPFGASFRGDSSTWSYLMLKYLFYPHGVRILTDDLREPDPSLQSDAAIEVLEGVRAIVLDGSTPTPTAWSYTDNIVAWQQGRMATSNFYSARPAAIEEPGTSQVIGQVGYTLGQGVPTAAQQGVPAPPAGPHRPAYAAGPYFVGVSAASRNPDQAWEFAKFLTTDRSVQETIVDRTSQTPGLLSVLEGERFRRKNPAADVIVGAVRDHGMIPELIPQMPVVYDAIHAQMQELYSGAPARAVAAGLHDAIGQTLDGLQ